MRNYRARPGALKFLNEMYKYYEIVVFTAGLKDYADWILNDLDRQGYISYRLYRDHTKFKNGIYMKDLSKLGRPLEKTIIIDNISENFMAQPDNGIHIRGWYNDPRDTELEKLTPFLQELVINKIPDVRPELKNYRFHALHKGHDSRFQSPPRTTSNYFNNHSPINYLETSHSMSSGKKSTTHSSPKFMSQQKPQPVQGNIGNLNIGLLPFNRIM